MFSSTGGSARKHRTAGGRSIAAGVVGNLIEGYDWNLYGLMAVYFASSFFVAGDATSSLLTAFITFGLGFVVRPLGAFILAPLADRLGRKQVLTICIIIIGAASLVMAITPGYASIGIAATIVFVTARLVQGLSFGAEWQVAAAFLGENSTPRRRALVTSAQTMTGSLGVLLATGLTTLGVAVLGTSGMKDWGWRLPFLIGALLSLFGLYIRRRVPETEVFTAAQSTEKLTRTPLRTAFREHPKAMLQTFAIEAAALPFLLWLVLLPSIAHTVSGIGLGLATGLNLISLTFYTLLLPVFAYVSDRWLGRRPFLLASAVCFAVSAFPLFNLLRRPDGLSYMIVALAGCTFLAMAASVQSALLTELFPTRVRATASGIAYATSAAIFGGTAPFLTTLWLKSSMYYMIPLTLCVVMVLAGLVYLTIPETRGTTLTGDEPGPVIAGVR